MTDIYLNPNTASPAAREHARRFLTENPECKDHQFATIRYDGIYTHITFLGQFDDYPKAMAAATALYSRGRRVGFMAVRIRELRRLAQQSVHELSLGCLRAQLEGDMIPYSSYRTGDGDTVLTTRTNGVEMQYHYDVLGHFKVLITRPF